MTLRRPRADELQWQLTIMCEGEIEVEFYETRRDAEEAAETALESHGVTVYVARIEVQS